MPSPGAERVARALHDGGPGTAAELASRLGSSPTVVRRHLEALVAEGLVAASVERPYGPAPVRGRGRPGRVFTLTDEGAHAFTVAYDDLALSALRFIADTGGPEAVSDFARRRARDLETRHAAIAAADGLEDRVALLADRLSEDGYVAATDDVHGPQLCQHHCPVSHVAADFPQLCEAETEAFERLLGTHVLRIATIAHGDGVCTTLVPALMNRRSTA